MDIKKYIRSMAKNVPIWPLIFGIIMILVGIIYDTHGEDLFTWMNKNSTSLFLKEIGFAFIIAYVISIGIEKKARDEHNALIESQMVAANRNVFEAIYKIRMPEGVFEQIEETIIKQPFFRKGVRIIYELEIIDNPINVPDIKQIFIVKVSLNYQVENISKNDERFDIKLFIERPLIRELSDHVNLNDLRIDGKSLPSEELQKAKENWPDTDESIRYSYGIDVAKGEVRKVELSYTMVKLHRDYEVWRSLYPCDGMCLTVKIPKGLNLSADKIHPNELVPVFGKPGDTLWEWRIEQPVLPAQGILIWWSP